MGRTAEWRDWEKTEQVGRDDAEQEGSVKRWVGQDREVGARENADQHSWRFNYFPYGMEWE